MGCFMEETQKNAKTISPLIVGLLAVVTIWLLFSVHELFKAMVNINEYLYLGGQGPAAFWVMVTDYSGAVGLVARTLAGVVAVAAVVLYAEKGAAASSSARRILQWILVAEAIYWLSLLLSGIWGLLPVELAYGVPGQPNGLHWNPGFVIETGLPCIVESILLPILLFKMAYELRISRPPENAAKWALITGAAYIFVFWLGNTGNWLYVGGYTGKGWAYVTAYPENLLSFAITTVGLFALFVFSIKFALKRDAVKKIDLRVAGAVVTLVGLYFLWNYLTWIFFGGNVLWSDWYAWFLGHNMDLWVLALPLVGLPLLLRPKSDKKTETA